MGLMKKKKFSSFKFFGGTKSKPRKCSCCKQLDLFYDVPEAGWRDWLYIDGVLNYVPQKVDES